MKAINNIRSLFKKNESPIKKLDSVYKRASKIFGEIKKIEAKNDGAKSHE